MLQIDDSATVAMVVMVIMPVAVGVIMVVTVAMHMLVSMVMALVGMRVLMVVWMRVINPAVRMAMTVPMTMQGNADCAKIMHDFFR